MKHGNAIILVLERNTSVRSSLEQLVTAAGYRIETFGSVDEFMVRASYRGIGCVLLNLPMPGCSGLEILTTWKASGSTLPVIVLSSHSSVPLGVKAMKWGAADFLVKPLRSKLVLRAIEEAVDASLKAYTTICEMERIQGLAASLTPREREVFREVIAGYPNKLIAEHLGTVEKTIKVHRGRVMRKMEAASIVDLVRMGEKLGVTPLRGSLPSPSALAMTSLLVDKSSC